MSIDLPVHFLNYTLKFSTTSILTEGVVKKYKSQVKELIRVKKEKELGSPLLLNLF